ncbi:MAG: hypothetical protein LBN30_05585, partial [Oscillospiraceae bacterium]|nr:hypothetical protein [Oscillospiraceae bacterium]
MKKEAMVTNTAPKNWRGIRRVLTGIIIILMILPALLLGFASAAPEDPPYLVDIVTEMLVYQPNLIAYGNIAEGRTDITVGIPLDSTQPSVTDLSLDSVVSTGYTPIGAEVYYIDGGNRIPVAARISGIQGLGVYSEPAVTSGGTNFTIPFTNYESLFDDTRTVSVSVESEQYDQLSGAALHVVFYYLANSLIGSYPTRTVTFDGNFNDSGTVPQSINAYPWNAYRFAIPYNQDNNIEDDIDDTLKRESYLFRGWKDIAPPSTVYSGGAVVVATENVALRAEWGYYPAIVMEDPAILGDGSVRIKGSVTVDTFNYPAELKSTFAYRVKPVNAGIEADPDLDGLKGDGWVKVFTDKDTYGDGFDVDIIIDADSVNPSIPLVAGVEYEYGLVVNNLTTGVRVICKDPFTVPTFDNWGGIFGVIKSEIDEVADSVTIETRFGDELISAPVILRNFSGSTLYRLLYLPDGYYNITVTAKIGTESFSNTFGVKIAGNEAQELNISVSNAKQNAVKKVTENAPDIVVFGLDKLFELGENNTAYTSEDADLVSEGGAVHFDLQSGEGTGGDGQFSLVAADMEVVQVIDLSLAKSRFAKDGELLIPGEGDSLVHDLGDKLLTIVIPVPELSEGRGIDTIYRIHEGELQQITKKAVDGEYSEIDEYFEIKGDYILLHVKKFSAFALASKVYIISASAGANGTISPSGGVPVRPGETQVFTITPNRGYHIYDVLVDGVSVGAVDVRPISNVNESHSIVASFAEDLTFPGTPDEIPSPADPSLGPDPSDNDDNTIEPSAEPIPSEEPSAEPEPTVTPEISTEPRVAPSEEPTSTPEPLPVTTE